MRRFPALCILACHGALLFGQQGLPPALTGKSRTLILVAEPRDSSIATLAPSDLEIKEDGKNVNITNIRKLAREPIHYCVLFDISKSESANFKIQQKAATALLTQVIQPGTDRGWILFFNQASRESSDTDQPQQLAALLSQFSPIGATALYDSIATCAARMTKTTSPQGSALPLIFLFSDGDDNQSHLTRQQAAGEVLKSGSRIYAFSSGNNGERGKVTLSWFTELTGGRSLETRTDKEITSSIRRLNDDLTQLNEVVYSAQIDRSDSEHKIQVKVRDKRFSVLAPELTQ